MENKRTSFHVDLTEFAEPGLYLIFPDGTYLALTRPFIDKTAQRFLADPDLIPDSVKAAAQFQPCAICPERHSAEICHAILPILPFVEQMEEYASHDKITAVFRDVEDDLLYISFTDMQHALFYVAALSLWQYCEVGREYSHFFEGVHPLMSIDQMSAQVFRVMHETLGGDLVKMERVINDMSDELLTTANCQMDRLRLISRSDVFLNAFANAYGITQWLTLSVREKLTIRKKSDGA